MFKRRFLVFGLCAFLPVVALHEYIRRTEGSDSLQKHTTSQSAVIPAAARSLRPNYPYSVVAGGVYSPAELREAAERDSVVKKHYSDFDIAAARVVKLTEDQYQYVSFRMGDKTFWTHKKLRIPKGEILLSDGHNYARTRCGNRLSEVRKGNTTTVQVSDESLSLPPFSPGLSPEFTLAEAPSAADVTVLPYAAPRLAPVLPPPIQVAVKSAESWPPLTAMPGMIPVAAPTTMGFPEIPTPPGAMTHTPPAPVIPKLAVLPPTVPVPVDMPQVPEPGTTSLLGVGLLVAFLVTGRRRLH